MEFRPVRLEDKAAIEHFTRPSGICNCDLAFANMYCWEGTYRSAWCVEEGFLLIRFYIDGSHHIGYMQPLGEGDFTHLIPRLEADARAAGQPLRISGLTPEGAAAVRRARLPRRRPAQPHGTALPAQTQPYQPVRSCLRLPLRGTDACTRPRMHAPRT